MLVKQIKQICHHKDMVGWIIWHFLRSGSFSEKVSKKNHFSKKWNKRNLLHRKVVYLPIEQFVWNGFLILSLTKSVFWQDFLTKIHEFLGKWIGAQYEIFKNVEILHSIIFSHKLWSYWVKKNDMIHIYNLFLKLTYFSKGCHKM